MILLAGCILAVMFVLIFLIAVLNHGIQQEEKREREQPQLKQQQREQPIQDKQLQKGMTLKEVQRVLKWLLQMGIIDTTTYQTLFNKALQYVKG